MEWYQKSQDAVLKDLDSTKDGLSDSQAQERLAKYGPNKLKEKTKTSLFEKLFAQFKDPMVLILIAAAILSAVIDDITETFIILAIVVVNAIMSIVQEGKAEDSVEALQKMSSPTAKVKRNGKIQVLKSEELVPGDIISLETGDIVPADMRLLESSNLKIDESSFTGESVAVEKDASVTYDKKMEIGDRQNYAYSSTIVTYGHGLGVVTETGHDTEIGKIATTIATYEEGETPLQKKLGRLSKQLGILVIAVCIVVFGVGLFRKMDILDVFMTSISLAVAAIPEGMTAVVTIVLSLGMNRMAKEHAIVKKLLAVETLGTTTVICSDKTGTLTQNEMTVTRAYVNGQEYKVEGTGYRPVGKISRGEEEVTLEGEPQLGHLMNIASLANDAELTNHDDDYDILGDPTEGALLTFAGKLGKKKKELNEKYPRIAEHPFDSERKMMTTFHEHYEKDKVVSFTKGAPDIVIEKCDRILLNGEVVPFDEEKKKKALEKNNEFARQALRVLAYAYRVLDELPQGDKMTPEETEQNMIFVGLSGMIDPPRLEVKDAIKETKSAGITTIMITGDYLETALAIGKDLGIAERDDQAIMGRELNNMTPEEIREIVKEKRIFARVSPENKVQIVTALKENGHITAMTGDGVNDAPAIKKADIGISMGITGTDVAKNTADVILTDDNFATIVNAVEEGRIIYSNIKKFVSFLLSCNVGEVIVILVAMLVGWPVPLTPIQLLWLNLVTDSFPALALGVEEGEKDIMNQPPRHPGEPIIDKAMKQSITVQSIAIGVATLASFYFGYHSFSDGNLLLGQTMAFATLILAELLRSFSVRSNKYTLTELGLFTNKALIKAVGVAVVLLLVVLYVPVLQELFDLVFLGTMEWGVILTFALLPFLASEFHKIIKRNRDK